MEKKYYIVSCEYCDYKKDYSDLEFIKLAKSKGKVLTEEEFVTHFNEDYLDVFTDYLRIL